jgi:hypothetical protein
MTNKKKKLGMVSNYAEFDADFKSIELDKSFTYIIIIKE